MNLGFFFKTICDLALWFGGAGFILSQFGASFSLWPLSLMALACGLSRPLRDRGSLRLLPLVILPSTVFWIHSIPDALLILPPALYCSYLCIRGRFDPDLLTCRSYWRNGALGMILASAFFAIVGTGAAVAQCILPSLMLFLPSGVLMLRALRRGSESLRPRELILDLLLLCLCFTAAWGLSSSAALHLIGQGISFLHEYLISPLLIGLIYISAGLAEVLVRFILLLSSRNTPSSQETQTDFASFTDLTQYGVSTGDAHVFRIVIEIVAAAALLFVAYLIFRRLGKSGARHNPVTPAEIRIFTLAKKATPPASFPMSGPRGTVRRCYRRFLIRARDAGVPIAPGDTSAAILQLAAGRFDPKALRDLRSLYIAARYSPAPVSRESASGARRALSRLKPIGPTGKK